MIYIIVKFVNFYKYIFTFDLYLNTTNKNLHIQKIKATL